MNKRSGIICAGNWIVDIVHDITHWPNKSDLVRITAETTGVGGGAANVVSDLRSFGAKFPLIPVGKIGTDSFATVVLDHCRDFDLPVEFLVQTASAPTGHTHVMNVPGDSRTFFYQAGANDTLDVPDVPVDELAGTGARIFYLGYLMLLKKLDEFAPDGTTGAARLLHQIRAAGMTTCIDLVSADTPRFSSLVAAALPHIDYLILNETELARASNIDVLDENGAINEKQTEAAARHLLQQGVGQAVVVHSPEFALWLTHDKPPFWSAPVAVPAHEIVSPVGAGDAFCAGVLYGLHEGWDVEKIMTLAHRAARAALYGQTATDGIPTVSSLFPDC